MTQVSELINNYKAIRSRLRQPSNQVKDQGINLNGYRILPKPLPTPKVEEYRSPIHCKVSIQIIPKSPIEPVIPRKVTMSIIERAVCRVYGVTKKALWSRSREAWLVLPRHVAWYIACKHTDLSYPQIGLKSGNGEPRSGNWFIRNGFLQTNWRKRRGRGRDHTTIMSAKLRIAELIMVDEELAEKIRLVEFLSFGGYCDQPNHTQPTFLNLEQ